MIRTQQTEVLVVGAGPVGLLTALLLTDKGIKVQIIDQQWRTAVHSYACALHPSTLKLLAGLGLADRVQERGRRIETVAYYGGDTRQAELKLSSLGVTYPYIVVLPQSDFEELLEQELARKHVEVQWNHRLSRLQTQNDVVVGQIDRLAETSKGYIVADLARVVERTSQVRASFVVGADGHDSVLRQLLDIEMETFGAPELYEVFEIVTDTEPASELRVLLNETMSVYWPLPGRNCRWSFQVPTAGLGNEPWEKERLAFRFADQALNPDTLDRLQKRIKKHAPWFQGKPCEVDWSVVIQFQKRLARRFGEGRCWLVGDAAHQTGPVGAQSMNIGLNEAEDLATKLAQVVRDPQKVDLLQAYHQKHHSDWERLISGKTPLRAGAQANTWVKQHAARILPCVPASGQELAPLLAQLGLEW